MSVYNKVITFEFNKFLFVGVINTIVTYIIYLMGLIFFSFFISYSISFISGILISYWLNLRYVFQSTYSPVKLILYFVNYGLQYGAGVSFLYFFINYLDINAKIAPLVMTLIIVPITFLFNKIILKDK